MTEPRIAQEDITEENTLGQTVVVVPAGQPIPPGVQVPDEVAEPAEEAQTEPPAVEPTSTTEAEAEATEAEASSADAEAEAGAAEADQGAEVEQPEEGKKGRLRRRRSKAAE